MIKNCLIVDVETTGLDPEKDRVTEVAAILYSLEAHCSLMEFSMLTGFCSDDIVVQHLTGITNIAAVAAKEWLKGYYSKHTLTFMASRADCVIAHNAAFDSQWLEFEGPIPWLCTLEDFKWPGIPANAYSLAHLAITLGVPVCGAHRALTDCRLLASILCRVAEQGHDLQELFRVASRPKHTYIAVDDGKFFQKSQAEQERIKEERRTNGFVWNRIVQKAWARRMPEEDALALPFTVRKFK